MSDHTFAKRFDPRSKSGRGIVSPLFKSRRFGYTIGINPLGNTGKVCSYNCQYCGLGPTLLRLGHIRGAVEFPSVEEIVTALRTTIEASASDQPEIQTLSLQGYGEPTLYPFFPELVDALLDLKTQIVPRAKVNLITNAMQFDKKKIKLAAQKLDQVVAKIDAGTDEVLKKINNPLVRVTADIISSNLRGFEQLAVQAYFLKGSIDNTSHECIEDWMELVGMVGPHKIFISSIRAVPGHPELLPVEEDRLFHIAQKLQRKSRYEVLVVS